jgi:hypothetical protein
MSGGWTTNDQARVRNNVFRKQWLADGQDWPGGIIVSTSNDIVIQATRSTVKVPTARTPSTSCSARVGIRHNLTREVSLYGTTP